MSVVPTRSRKSTGRGGLTLAASALGLALAVAGGVASARSDAETAAPSTTAVAAPDPATRVIPVPPTARPAAPAYTTAPPVELQGVVEKERTPRVHPAKGTPLRIVVPTLGIDHPIVGIDSPGGVLTPPGDPQVLGWWRAGAQPGAKYGSALVTGHTVSSGGGAFDHLETLGAGDRVRIRTANGRIDYRVDRVRIFRKASLVDHAERIFSQDVPGRLVLITCEDWNGSVYLSNAVVIAHPEV